MPIIFLITYLGQFFKLCTVQFSIMVIEIKCHFLRGQELTIKEAQYSNSNSRISGVITLLGIKMSNHYTVYLKLI